MTSSWQPQERSAVERRRRAPVCATHLVVTYAAGGRLPDEVPASPLQIILETTNAGGDLASWFHDDWFTGLIRRFGDDYVTLRIAPTPEAILHPCVCHQAEMVRRVLPHWRVIASAYLSDIQATEDIRSIAASPYHEVRFFDQVRPGAYLHNRLSPSLSVEDLIGQIRRYQATHTGRSPVLVRLPARASVTSRRPDVPAPCARPAAVPSSVKQ